MRTSDLIQDLSKAMCESQKMMKPALKDSINPHFKSKYSDISSIWEAIRDPLTSNGLTVWQDVTTEEKKVSITTRIVHTTGQWVEFGPLCVPLSKCDAHGVGSAISYGKRYALCAAVGVVSGEDDDGNTASSKPSVLSLNQENKHVLDKNMQKIAPEMAKALELQLKQTPSKYSDSVYARFIELGYPTIYDIPQSMFEAVLSNATKNIGKPNV